MWLRVAGWLIILLLPYSCKREEEVKHEEQGKEGKIIGLEQKYFNIPSPIQIMKILEASNIKFNEEWLLPADRVIYATTSPDKFFYLGVYMADFAYSVVCGSSEKSTVIMTAIAKLLDETGISGIVKEDVLKSIEKNIGNKDSLLSIASKIVTDLNVYLQENKFEEKAVFMLIGGWLKSIFYSSYLYEQTKNNEILKFIVEQKYSYDNIVFLMKKYSGIAPEINDFLIDMQELSSFFSKNEPAIDSVTTTTDKDKRITKVSVKEKLKTDEQEISKFRTTIEEILRKKLS